MTAILNQDFVTYAGDDVFPIFTVQDSAGAAIDISTVAEISWSAVRNSDSAVAVTLTKSGGKITFVTGGTDGKFQVQIASAVTTNLSGMYRHTATITDALGNKTTIEVGRMQVGVKPAWTYDAASVTSSPLYQVRRLIGDVIKNDQQLFDDEISFFISQRSSIYGAAADACRAIAAQYSRKVDVTSPGEIRTAYSVQATAYARRAKELDEVARNRGAGITPFAGGISIADKTARQQDTDRVQPSFNIGFTDNLLPIGPVGNETPTMPLGGSAP